MYERHMPTQYDSLLPYAMLVKSIYAKNESAVRKLLNEIGIAHLRKVDDDLSPLHIIPESGS